MGVKIVRIGLLNVGPYATLYICQKYSGIANHDIRGPKLNGS